MRRSAHVVPAVLALSSCRDGGDQEPRTTAPTAPGRTITVRQVWTAGPNGGVVPVTQLQAVRNR